MSSIQEAFGAYMLAAPTLVALVPKDETTQAPAIYPTRGLQDSSVDPYIVWKCSVYKEEQEIGGPPVIANATFSVSCFSNSYDTAQALAVAVEALFRFQSVPISMGSFTVLGTWVESARDEDASDVGLYEAPVEISMQFQIR